MWQTAYESTWHHPGAAFAGGLALAAWLVARPHAARARALGLALAGLACLDAWLTGPLGPLAEGSGAATVVSVGLVILGDARFYYLYGRQAGAWWPGARSRTTAVASAALAGCGVPIVAWAATRLTPGALPSPRHLFLVHELAFASVAAALIVAARRVRFVGSKTYAARLAWFELAQYAGWALADAVILAGKGGGLGDAGFGLRILPNVAYYALFAPAACLGLPREART